MLIEIPNHIIQECIDCHHIQQKGSSSSIEGRCLATQKLEYHIAEIVSAIIIKEFNKQKRLPYNSK